LDGSNNSIEDVYISGFSEGILVGSRLSSQANLIYNVSGGLGVTKLIHISSQASLYSNCPPGTQNPLTNLGNVSAQNVCDLTVLGVTVSVAGANSIYDDITNTHLTDANVEMYALGEQTLIPKSGGMFPAYSLFTTSSSANSPTWFVGSGTPSFTCTKGSLYSMIFGTGPTVWGCLSGGWTNITTI
jgi:hypothetical protein